MRWVKSMMCGGQPRVGDSLFVFYARHPRQRSSALPSPCRPVILQRWRAGTLAALQVGHGRPLTSQERPARSTTTPVDQVLQLLLSLMRTPVSSLLLRAKCSPIIIITTTITTALRARIPQAPSSRPRSTPPPQILSFPLLPPPPFPSLLSLLTRTSLDV